MAQLKASGVNLKYDDDDAIPSEVQKRLKWMSLLDYSFSVYAMNKSKNPKPMHDAEAGTEDAEEY